MDQLSFFYCRNSLSSRLNRYAAVFFYPFIAFSLLSCTIYLVIESLCNTEQPAKQIFIIAFVVILSLIISCYMIKMCRKIYRLENRAIALTEYGFSIKDGFDKQYAWKQISCVGIIIFSATASKQNYSTQICIFLRDPCRSDLKKLRDSYLYGAFNYDKFILIDYTPTLLDKLTQSYALTIVDYRHEQLHRIT